MVLPLLRRGARFGTLRLPHRTLKTGARAVSSLSRARELWRDRIVVSEEVEHALETSQPVIALETAIVTHGMPYPTNLETASSLESIVRSRSVTPATIALFGGKVHVGLNKDQLSQLADPDSQLAKGAVKVSRRDLGPALALKRTGGTTVAGTMYIASSLGVKVFVTGGIGGVHRGAESSMDVSADLIELGRTPMAVVCAGAKSILDIPRTLEVLETQGVCVATYGANSDFPAFYHPSSGCKSPWTVGDVSAAANLIHTSLSLPTPLSTLLAVPIPSEHTEAGAEVQQAVEQAVRESIEQGIDKRGKEVTPWLLKRVGELTRGKALGLNIKLIENNARIGADVAVKVAKLFREQGKGQHASMSAYSSRVSSSAPAPIPSSASHLYSEPFNAPPASPLLASTAAATLAPPSVLVFGSAAIDLTSTSPHPLAPGTTTPGTVFVSPGGVGRNIAEAAQNLLPGGAVQLVSAYGASGIEPDAFGKLLMYELGSAGLRTDGLVPVPCPKEDQGKEGYSTAVCSLTLERDGDLVAGVADMGIVETITKDIVRKRIKSQKPKMVVFDCNLVPNVIEELLRTCKDFNIPTFCDPTSTPKLPRIIPSLITLFPSTHTSSRPLSHLSPNVLELDLLHSLLSSSISDSSILEKSHWEYINSLNLTSDWRAVVDRFTSPQNKREWIRSEGIVQKMVALLPFIESFWVKAGSRGLLHLRITYNPSANADSIWQKLDGIHDGKYLVLTHYAAPFIDSKEIVSTTGAGDTLVGGLVAGLTEGKELEEKKWVEMALGRVERSLRSRRAVG